MGKYYTLICIVTLLLLNGVRAQSESTAKKWNEEVLFAISADFARPTVHARNLFHTSIAMYDAWQAYEPGGNTYLLGKSIGPFESDFLGVSIPENADSAREMAISYAVYRLIEHRYAQSPGHIPITNSIDELMDELGYDPSIESTDYVNGGPAELGNYIAEQVIEFGFMDGANEEGNYGNLYYEPVNPPIEVEEPGNPYIIDPNRWQQIYLTESIDQSGELVGNAPDFLSPEWGNVIPFSMTDEDMTIQNRDGHDYKVYFDPGPPPFIDTTEASGLESFYKWNFVLVPIWQSHLDAQDTTVWDISPRSVGNLQNYPSSEDEFDNWYNLFEGGDPGEGYALNPVTGLPYEPQYVKRADYARVLAEFWADGPNSVTPPGHWFDIYNEVSEHPLFERKWEGNDPELDPLEYDVRAYLAIGGAMHDAAIAAWSIKGYYDYLRPVSAVRYMADKGQSSFTYLPNYHPAGIPLIEDYIELVGIGDPLAGPNNENFGKIKLYTWRGPDYIEDPETDEAGVGWILAENWWPYQRPSFVTPPFAGYISGHSTYSSTAAQVMTLMTGSEFFPGGMSGFDVQKNQFLVFEDGPSLSFELQWATYKDAADQCSLSRIWGGIHPPIDDIPGRFIGMELGPQAFNHANEIIQEAKPYITEISADSEPLTQSTIGENITITISFDQEMDQGVTPEIIFLESEINSALSEVNSTWIAANQFEITFQQEDVAVEGLQTTFTVQNAQNLSGKIQNPHLLVSPFQMDSKEPEILSIDQSAFTINNETISESEFSFTLSFSEPCDVSQEIEVALQSTPDLGNSLIFNPLQSGWQDSLSYSVVYDLTDENVQSQSVDLLVSLAEDLFGNEMDTTIIEDFVILDTKSPIVANITVNDDLLNIQDYGVTDLIITIEFDEPMNDGINPELVFLEENPLGTSLTYNDVNTGWISPTTYEVHYFFEFFEAEFSNVGISLDAFTDFNGNTPEEPEIPGLFSIDTKRPVVENINPISSTVSEQNIDPGQFYIDVAFSEIMNTDLPVLVQIDSDEAEESFLVDFFESFWTNDSTFRAGFQISDQNIEVENIGITIDFAADASGNPQNAFEQASILDLDTRNPELISLVSSDYFIDPSDIGEGSFNVIMVFDEEMDTEGFVDLSFTPEEPANSIIQANTTASEWLNPFTFKLVFDVVESEEVNQTLDAMVSNGPDAAGNPMAPFASVNWVTINMSTLDVYDLSENDGIRLYPTLLNTGDVLTLELRQDAGPGTFIIREVRGKIIQENTLGKLTAGKHHIPLTHSHAKGLYLYELNLGGNKYSGKLIIQ